MTSLFVHLLFLTSKGQTNTLPSLFADDGGSGESSAFVMAFDQILDGPFKTFTELSRKIGGEVEAQSLMVQMAFKAQRDYLVLAAKSRKPADPDLPLLLKPMSDKISEIQSYREANIFQPSFSHL